MANPSYMGLAGSLARARKPPAQNDVYMQQPRGTGRPPQQFGGSPTPYGNQLQQLASKPGLGGPYGSATQQGFTPSAGFGGGIAGINATGGFQNPVSMSPPMGGGRGIGMMPPQGGGMGGILGGAGGQGFQGRPMDTSGGFHAQPGQFGFANPYGGAQPGGNPGDTGGFGGMDGQLGGMLGGGRYGGPQPGGGPSFGGGPQPFPSYDPLKNEKPMGGGVAMLGPPTPMQVPGFGGGPTMAKPMPLPGGGPVQTPLEDYQRRAPGRRFP